MKPLAIWGTTGQALVLAEFVERLGYSIVAFVDNDPGARSPIPEIAVSIGIEAFTAWRRTAGAELYGAVAIGGEHGAARLECAEHFERHGVEIVSLVHPAAYVAQDAQIAAGVQIMAGAVVATRARVGRGTIVNTRASVDHECSLAEGVHVGPGAILAGCVRVDERAFIGTGAVVLPRVVIGAGAIVGAGAVVVDDVPPNSVVTGNPARIGRYTA